MSIAGDCEIGTYAELFVSRAMRNPASTAVSFRNSSLTYAELDERSDAFAARLRLAGIRPETVVAVALERSVELIIALLGVLKAGGAYLPLGTDLPVARMHHALQDSGAALIVTSAAGAKKLAGSGVELLRIDQNETSATAATPGQPASPLADSLAYVMYTSGSTGQPKGVEITHRSLLNHNFAVMEAFGLSPEDRVLQFASLSFDISVEEIFPSLLAGCRLVLRTDECIGSIPQFLKFLEENGVTVLNLPTSFWHQLTYGLGPEGLPDSVRLVVIGGEKASDQAWNKWKNLVSPSVRLINTYGPTETTVSATLFEPKQSDEALCIGTPIANVRPFILDADLRPVADGEVGELFLGGPGVARGYRNRPELTAERFLRISPGPGLPPERVYRTGDLVCRRADGKLDFIGRNDQQIKVRGFRVEPSEITAALLECGRLQDAAVALREISPGNKQLIAYGVAAPGDSLDSAKLLAALRARLPRYMVPAAVVPMPVLPRKASGKLDEAELPMPGNSRPELKQEYLSPRSRTERELAIMWQEVLGLETVGIKDNFFDLGGDSLLGLQLASRIQQAFGRDVGLATIFDRQTIEAMALDLAGPANSPSAELDLSEFFPGEPIPASWIQEQLWFLHQMAPRSDAYHLPFALRLEGPLEQAALGRAIDEIIARHDSLRATFAQHEGVLVQEVAPVLRLGESLLGEPFKVDSEATLSKLLEQEAQTPFDLERGPLLRLRLVRRRANVHVLLVVMHHIISDGWSVGLFLRELEMFYSQFATKVFPENLAPPPLSYAHYARWQRRHMAGAALESQLGWWQNQLKGAPGEIRLARGPMQLQPDGKTAERLGFHLSRRQSRKLSSLAKESRTTPFVLLLTALAATLHARTEQSDLVIGTVVAGRARREFESIIGCFMNFLPLRIRVAPQQGMAGLLEQVGRVVLEAQAHQEYPFQKLVSTLQPERAQGRNPLYNVALLWQQFPVKTIGRAGGLSISTVETFARAHLLDLRFEAELIDETICVRCEYDPAVLNRECAREIVSAFASAIDDLLGEVKARTRQAASSGVLSRFRRKLSAWSDRQIPPASRMPTALEEGG